jgi:transposase InsO family protein
VLSGEIFHALLEARTIIERWRPGYNQVRPHSARWAIERRLPKRSSLKSGINNAHD